MITYHPTIMDLSKSKTFTAKNRTNLVTVDNMLVPGTYKPEPFDSEEFEVLCKKMEEARRNHRPVVCFFGAHVIKCGLSNYLLWFLKHGYITHLAGNGACSIHDFELSYLGGTSEHVPTAIEDGSFGMWEETGRYMNEAIIAGAAGNYGYGESLAHYVDDHPERFPYREHCVFYQAYLHGVPATYHVTMGTDIIHEHPICNFEALGKTSGRDFGYFCHSLSELEGGVFLNIGSAITGPEVFLKALSICRNQGYGLKQITTANFDIIPLGDYRSDVSKEHFHYYYRPRKNVINRPASLGGTGLYIEGNHMLTLPNLYERLKDTV